MKKKWILIIIVVFIIIFESFNKIVSKDNEKKEVVFLNNFISYSDKLSEYEETFEKLHPDIDIKIETVGDKYESICILRLNAHNAGDVMVIPASMNQYYYTDFYEPLYTVEEAAEKYRFTHIKAIDNKVYSIPLSMDISGGILYDKKVLEDAGIDYIPKTLNELRNALEAVKNNTDAVALYTNARGESELAYWNSLVYCLKGDSNYNTNIIYEMNLFDSQTEYYNVYKFLYDCVKENLIEDSYVKSKWEDGIKLLKEGKLGAAVVSEDMYLQAKQNALNSESIVYMPLKCNNDDNYYLYGEPSYGLGINNESNTKEEAKMWIEFLLDDTDFLDSIGENWMLVKNQEPQYIKEINESNIKIIYPEQKSKDMVGVFEKVDDNSCLGLTGGSFIFNLIDEAANGDKAYSDLCNDWNEKWNIAKDEVNNK